MSRDAMPAMRISPSVMDGSGRDPEDALEAGRAGALHEHPVARTRQLLEQRSRLLRARDRVCLTLEAPRVGERLVADRHQHVDPQLVGALADLDVEALGAGA